MKIGTKEFSKAKVEEDKETEKKKSIEETNIMMRKKAGKMSQKKKSSAPKRRKINEENGYKEQKISSMEYVTENIGEKRNSEDDDEVEKESDEMPNPMKKRYLCHYSS